MLSTETALQTIGDRLVTDVVSSQSRKGLRASSYSAKNTRAEISTSGHMTTLRLLGPAYWRQQQNGRRPGEGKKPPGALVAAIKEWVKVKGIDIPAYAIAVKIHRDGIKVPNRYNPGGVLSEPLEPKRIAQEISISLLPSLTKDIRTELFR